MKRMSLKIRISLWFTILLMLISIAVFLIAAEVYWNYEEQMIRNDLLDAVEEEAFLLQMDSDYIEKFDKGEIPASDFLKDDIYLMVFDKNGNRVSGIFINEELAQQPFSDSFMPRYITVNGHKYYYYDEWVGVRDNADLCIRGVTKAEKSLLEILGKHLYLLFAFPLLLVLAFFGCCWLTGRFLKPIKNIDKTAEKIRKSGDLSNRIETSGAKDEISALAENINAMFDQLETNFESQRQFASNVSHELRTPVAVIMAQCEYAMDNASDEQDLYQALSAVRKQGVKMSYLIDGLLLFNRIEQGTGNYQKEEISINELVFSSCEDFRILAENGITIETQAQQEVSAFVNRDLFTLMLNNLIQNAISYGKENGTVCVKLNDGNDTFTISVSDDGQGITEENLPYIWNLFYRGDKSRNSRGLGLGLSLVKQIVKYHNGTIVVESAPGQGTEFIVTLPKTDL